MISYLTTSISPNGVQDDGADLLDLVHLRLPNSCRQRGLTVPICFSSMEDAADPNRTSGLVAVEQYAPDTHSQSESVAVAPQDPDIPNACLRVVPNCPQDALSRGSLQSTQVSFRLARVNGRARHTPNSLSRSS
jgi:hypothetical protein